VTYRCGIGAGMAALGITPRDPHVVCDGCGLVATGVTHRGFPTAWLRNGKSPPGWLMTRVDLGDEGIFRSDWCKKCRPAKAATARR
jgi:hypothetical protein